MNKSFYLWPKLQYKRYQFFINYRLRDKENAEPKVPYFLAK